MKFKKGDRVKFISKDCGNRYGKYGIVTSTTGVFVSVKLDGESRPDGWFEYRLELANAKSEMQKLKEKMLG